MELTVCYGKLMVEKSRLNPFVLCKVGSWPLCIGQALGSGCPHKVSFFIWTAATFTLDNVGKRRKMLPN